MWQEKDYPESLRLYRYFSGNQIDEEELCGGAVVASIQQLFYRLKSKDPIIAEILCDCGAAVDSILAAVALAIALPPTGLGTINGPFP